MDFELNIGTLSNTIKEYYNGLKSLSEQKEIINNTVSNLYDSGWSGEARDKFETYHSQLQQKYNELEEDIEYIKNVLESYEKSQAALLKRRCEGFVECVALGGVSVEGTSDDEGKISLDFLGLTNMREMIDRSNIERYNKMNTILSEISQVTSNFSYTSFNLDYDIEECETSIGNQTMRLRNFDESLGLYYQEVKEIESNVLSQFGKISVKSEDIAPLVSDWSVLIDKDSEIWGFLKTGKISPEKLKELMLKDVNNLTDEEKLCLEMIKHILGEKEYNLVKSKLTIIDDKSLSMLSSEIEMKYTQIGDVDSSNEQILMKYLTNSSDGKIDQNKIIQLMLKDPSQLTDEEKNCLDSIKYIIGEERYDLMTKGVGIPQDVANMIQIKLDVIDEKRKEINDLKEYDPLDARLPENKGTRVKKKGANGEYFAGTIDEFGNFVPDDIEGFTNVKINNDPTSKSSMAGGFLSGILDNAYKQAEGIKDIFFHPIDTDKNITKVLFDSDYREQAIDSIKKNVSDAYEKEIVNGDPTTAAHFWGEGFETIASVVIGGEAGETGEASEVTSASSEFLDVTKGVSNPESIPKRPSWRQSELDVQSDLPDYNPQKSFIDGDEVPYGTKGSSRPDFYKEGASIEVKNYKVTTSEGRSRLINNISNQVNKRIIDLPSGTSQAIIIDVRGQNVSNDVLRSIRDKILEKSNVNVNIQFKR